MNGVDLQGRIAFVTGGTRGIGEAIVQTLAGAGARVATMARTADATAAPACTMPIGVACLMAAVTATFRSTTSKSTFKDRKRRRGSEPYTMHRRTETERPPLARAHETGPLVHFRWLIGTRTASERRLPGAGNSRCQGAWGHLCCKGVFKAAVWECCQWFRARLLASGAA